MKFTHDEIERGLQKAMRTRGWLVPTNVPTVETAERSRRATVPRTFSDPTALLNRLPVRPGHQRSQQPHWTHPSVTPLQAIGDPIEVIIGRARHAVLKAIESGWSGPPYDPFVLADYRGIKWVPTQEAIDARIVPIPGKKLQIEFNPDRPLARLRYSVAHELAHSLFDDCGLAVRNRASNAQMVADDWQLETLCNIGAAEILMPFGSLSDLESAALTMESVLHVRDKFQVSAEAVLLRLARLTNQPCLVFACHFNESRQRYRLDYAFASRSWRQTLKPGFFLPADSLARECTAVDFTAEGTEQWLPNGDSWNLKYLAVPPYPGPGRILPRVLGIASPQISGDVATADIRYLKGDATQPRGKGVRIIVQVVNDRGLTWGAGFALAVRRKWPDLQTQFTDWALSRRTEFRLGVTKFIEAEPSVVVANLVAQHGYGPSPTPRIRYSALAAGLAQVSEYAVANGATVHMPRIGCGQAAGNWAIIRDMIDETLCGSGVNVTVYDPPSTAHPNASAQASFSFR